MADATTKIIIEGKDDASDEFEKVGRAADSLGSRVTSAAQNFFFLAESVSRVASIVADFVSGAVTFDAAVVRSGIAMQMTADETENLKNQL